MKGQASAAQILRTGVLKNGTRVAKIRLSFSIPLMKGTPLHAANVDPAQTRLRPAPADRDDHAALRAERLAPRGIEARPPEPGAGREALRRPQGQALLRIAATVPDRRADGGDGLGRPRGGGRRSHLDRRYGWH